MSIYGKKVLVTGANRGIGQALVTEALARGAERVYAGTRRSLVHADRRVTPLRLDVTSDAQILAAAQEIGSLDILINNAGVALYDDLTNRIATNVCLTAIERRGRRPLPSGLGAPAENPEAALLAGPEVPWLQPFPGVVPAVGVDPAAVIMSRAGIRLAFVAALQRLSARQRAILILRDVVEWPAAEVAELLGTTTTAVNSGLRRARAQLAQSLPGEDELSESAEPGRRALLDQFAAAIENADAHALAGLLRADVALEMPPLLTWFLGRAAVRDFIAAHFLTEPGGLRLVPVTANAEPAFAVYRRELSGAYQAHAILVPAVTPAGIARIIAFQDLSLFKVFGLPPEFLVSGAGLGPGRD